MKRRTTLISGILCLLLVCLFVVLEQAKTVGEEPEDESVKPNPSAIDPEGERYAKSFGQTDSSDTVTPDLPFLKEFAGEKRQRLLRHLATSAKWFIGRDRGKLFAYRRAVENGRWINSLHGYVSGSNDAGPEDHFQYRIVLGINGPVWTLPGPTQGKATFVAAATQPIDLKGQYDVQFKQGCESYLAITSTGGCAEIFEQSSSPKRPFTSLALKELKAEFDAVLVSETAKRRGFDPVLMPADSMKRGSAELKLANYFVPGMYQVYAYVNPGESGFVHLKGFGATVASKMTPFAYIFQDGEDSEEYVGWSNDPQEQFFCNCSFSCGQQLLSKQFALRLELWFTPDSGGPERKLIEKVFHVQGCDD